VIIFEPLATESMQTPELQIFCLPYSQKQNYPGEKLLGVAMQWHLLLGHDMVKGDMPWKNINILLMCYLYRN